MDKIIWQLGAETSQVRAEMDKAVASVNRGTSMMAAGFGTATRSHDRFLESNNRVTNQVQGFTRSLLSARNASDVLSAGLDRLENSTNLSLGKGIFLAGSAVAVQQIHQLHEEYKKLNAEVKKLLETSPAGMFRTSSDIQTNINKVTESLARLKKESQGGMWQNIKDAFGENLFTLDGELLPDSGKAGRRRATDIAGLQAKEDELKFAFVDKRRQRSDMKADELAGAPDYVRKAKEIQMAHDEANHAVGMMTQAAIELKLAFQELSKSVNERNMERSGRSLKETADSLPDVVNNSVTWEQYQASQQAKKALALKAQGEAERMAGNPEAAHNLFNQAGEAAEGITGLKPSEKMSADFKGALAVSEETLKIIAENTAKQFVNQ